jgi:hypothetical protein
VPINLFDDRIEEALENRLAEALTNLVTLEWSGRSWSRSFLRYQCRLRRSAASRTSSGSEQVPTKNMAN